MDSPGRSIAKAFTWRIVATTITFALTWTLTGRVEVALMVGSADSVVKLGAYFFHERAWARVTSYET